MDGKQRGQNHPVMDYKQKAQEIREARRALYEEAGRPSWHELYKLDAFLRHYPSVMIDVWCGSRAQSDKTRGVMVQMEDAATGDYAAPIYGSREFWKLLREVDGV